MRRRNWFGLAMVVLLLAAFNGVRPASSVTLSGAAASDAPNNGAASRIIRYSGTGEYLSEWPVRGQLDDLAIGPGGEVYVNINNSHRVVKYSAEGIYLTEWEVAAGEPGAIAVGPGGEVYVNINNRHRVVNYDPNGAYLTEWEIIAGQGGGIAVAPATSPTSAGDVYVNINQNYAVVRYSANGEYVTEWSTDTYGQPGAIAVGYNGEVFVNINNSHRVVMYSTTGENVTRWESRGGVWCAAFGGGLHRGLECGNG